MADERLREVRKIAVLRANAIGDFVVALPAIAALKAAYRDAEIVLLGKEWHAEFLSRRRSPIDRVIVIPPVRGVGADRDAEPQVLEDFFDAMRGERFDLAVQLHGGGRYSNPFVRRLGARYTAGLQACDAPSLDFTLPYVRWHHEVLRYLEVVSLVGAEAHMLEPVVEVTEADVIESYAAVPPQSQPLAVLHPAANDPGRWWSAEKFAAVGDALADAGAIVAINGTAEEATLASCVKNAMRSRALDLSGRISLCGLTGLLSRARLVVGNDSGPLHLAAALGCATVGIYWCGNFLNWAPLTRARHYCAVSWQLNCSVCGQQNLDTTCEHRVSFVDSVTVEEVATAALELFGTDARSSISHGPVC